MKQLHKIAYKIIKANNLSFLNRVKKEYLKISKTVGFNGSLKDLNKISEKNLNKLHMNFNKKSKNVNFNLINAFSEELKLILGKKIFLQRQPYLRAKKYNLLSTATVAHNDFDFGHSHLGFNLWTPMFDISHNEGIYLFDLKSSKKIYSSFKFDKHLSVHIKKSKYQNKKIYINLKFGEAVVFSNLCIHGASMLKEKYNRVSSNIHLQNFYVPIGEKGPELFTIAELNKNQIYKPIGI